MLTEELIRAKRDGRPLPLDELRAFVAGVTDGSVSDAQVGAFAMAVFFRGMSRDETVTLTLAMRDSGRVLTWAPDELPGPPLDKHSTGGVGDKVSLMLAPIVAACGGAVPMISGRGLGHGQGTVDKLEAIPGYRTDPDEATFRRIVREVGCAIIGQTAELAPADRRIYAIRDVTGTVESMPLITGSILSKKLAAGLSGLVMDVTYGSGAFMTDPAQARELATIIAQVATAAGCPTVAMLTDMNETLGRTAGHATEVLEAIAYLRGDGEREARLHEVTAGLAAQLLVIGRMAPDLPAAHAAVERVLADGSAAERFGRMVAALGGPSDLLEHPDRHVVPAPVVVPVPVSGEGFIAQVDTRALGLAIVGLGGGRSRPGESIDTGVGFSEVRPIGTPVRDGDPLLLVHARDRASGEAAARAVAAATVIGDAPPPRPVILDRIAG
jgi:thymidine phosphorylase